MEVRQTVMRKFLKFKDVEYGTLYNLLDNYIPLVLSIYSIYLKLNNFSEYFRGNDQNLDYVHLSQMPAL